MVKIHNLADVASKKIGDGTVIWQYSVILQGATLGKNCNVNCHTFIENDVVVGDNVTIKSGIYLWDGIRVEDDVFLGPNVVFTNDIYPRSKNWKEPVQTRVKKGASIGANSTILAGITVGEYALAGIASVITKNVPDHAIVYGNPAKIQGWVDRWGRKLKKIDKGRWISNDGDTYVQEANGLKEILR